MKITHICTSLNGGAGLCANRIMAATAKLGIDVRALIADGSGNYGTNVEVVRPNGIWSINRMCHTMAMLLAYAGIGPRFARIRRRLASESRMMRTGFYFTSPVTQYTKLAQHPWIKDADIVHLHWLGHFVDYASFFPNVNKPIVWTIHDENPALGGFHYSSWKAAAPQSFRRFDDNLMRIKERAYKDVKSMTLVALSTQMDAYLASSSLLSRFPRRIIHNGVDGTQFRSIDQRLAREILRIPQGNTVFVFAAGDIFEERKGLKELITAIGRLNLSNVSLICLGKAKKAAPSASFEVRCEGFIPNSALQSLYYSAADYFVMPSFQEAFAQTPIEAMACGCPVVAFPCSGTDSLINFGNGIVCKGFSVDALQDGLKVALSCTFDRMAIRRDVLSRFSYEVIAKQYMELYNVVLNNQ